MKDPAAFGEAMDRSQSGAPAAGRALRDRFSADEIFQRIVATADEEFDRSTRLLFMSGLAAGLSIGLTFLARAGLTGVVSGGQASFVGNLLYPIGFVLIVLGRYQLFTENTLTPVTLVLTRIASVPRLLRVWGVVLVANVLGAGLIAFLAAYSGALTEEAVAAATYFGQHALEIANGPLFWKSVGAGFVVASMVWLMHGVRDDVARFWIIYLSMLVIPTTEMFHCIIGSAEALYVVLTDGASPLDALRFFGIVVAGNTVGGVVLVGILNYSQTREQLYQDRDCQMLELSWRDWLFGSYSGSPDGSNGDHTPLRSPVTRDDHTRGPADAPVTILEYGDYECPFSRASQLALQRLQNRMGDDVRFAYRHFPLRTIHPNAQQAAMAAEAAGRQGRFWDMHDRLFHYQELLEEDALIAHAEALGLDVERFRDDLHDRELRERVNGQFQEGRENGVRGTPTIFINGRRYNGERSPQGFERAVKRQLGG